ncbi:ubiquitin carboxyl-terminal hydrolase 42- hypothetical protein [Limosa lapponica baueri]|uniref:Uncharacterized protein n=1 Tax=Limosa lapponica baueri TaxID=1758121 RepID=A0A2I0T4T3_LIMLA|nr:ubiquitin carboxyl-terminal hydrolase 42- hypothetical protein [Limosa lapponica baueri]
MHHRSFAEEPSILSIKMEPLEKLERSFLACTGRSLAQLRNDILQWKWDSPEEKPGALAEEEECKDDSDEELSQWEDTNIHNMWVNASVSELFQNPHVGPQERPNWPGSLDTEEAGDIAGRTAKRVSCPG